MTPNRPKTNTNINCNQPTEAIHPTHVHSNEDAEWPWLGSYAVKTLPLLSIQPMCDLDVLT